MPLRTTGLTVLTEQIQLSQNDDHDFDHILSHVYTLFKEQSTMHGSYHRMISMTLTACTTSLYTITTIHDVYVLHTYTVRVSQNDNYDFNHISLFP